MHAYQIFIDGVFNGDPHPGNVMLLPDGRLGLIDYGQVKRWTLPQRKAYAELIIALDNVKTGAGSKEEVVRAFHDELHMCTRDNNPDILYNPSIELLVLCHHHCFAWRSISDASGARPTRAN